MKTGAGNGGNSWRLFSSQEYRILDAVVLVFGFYICYVITRQTSGTGYAVAVWTVVLCFYFLFYRRLAQVIFWSWDTYRIPFFQRKNARKHGEEVAGHGEGDIRFHILVAAYNAGDSIVPVIKAIGNQEYPADSYHAWVITENKEQLGKDQVSRNIIAKTQAIARTGDVDESLIPLLWKCHSRKCSSLNDWISKVSDGSLRPFLAYHGARPVFLEELLTYLCDLNSQDEMVHDRLHPYFKDRVMRKLLKVAEKINRKATRIAADFERILGLENNYRLDDIRQQLIKVSIRNKSLQRIARDTASNLANENLKIIMPDDDSIHAAVKESLYSTQEVVASAIRGSCFRNIHHLDPQNRGFKPGALNIAYDYICNNNFIENEANTYFLIIDADSLLPVNALSTIAAELKDGDQGNDILQMVSTPTANYFCSGWFSKFIAIADALGAVGKWARSTRRQLKPDLHAGSGVVVPATLASYIKKYEGRPWAETTLTEDARLIVGQFGLMGGVRNKTKFAPVLLLEAVPNDSSFPLTYKSFWNQRRRWTLGGYDEFSYILRSPDWLTNSCYNQDDGKWEACEPGIRERLLIGARKLYRLGIWTWDHFIWGVGGFVALTHWWLISLFVIEPSSTISMLGLLLVLLAPLIILSTSTRQLKAFVPGGVSIPEQVVLYFLSFFYIWIYCLPVVATQLACLFGLRPIFVDWKPTGKPHYASIGTLDNEK